MVVFLFLHNQKGLFLFCKTGIIENKMAGDAVFASIQKLRFPLYRKLSGATFLDLGNVYNRIRDFYLFDVRRRADLLGAGSRDTGEFLQHRL